ncbi:M48 family metallopeptidase [Pseudomonas sp. M47T1]|uniref:M48 family metallopeptidase n=1 Tax=Pseudomonas sp. M47T1 TaxID=1179778 RepID=UPI0005BDE908|nr:M48 family metallopeptidase [Pseudomonas sp. M47T1]
MGARASGIRVAMGLAAATVLSACGTIKGAPDAMMNLVGPSTQSRLKARYVETDEVRQYYRLDAQRVSTLRLSYDGRSMPADDIRQSNVVDIPLLQNYLQGIVNRLVKGWPGEAPPLQVRIVDSNVFGPSADAYGNVFVPLGMLESVESEDEIAAMLGHEISHVLLHHHDRDAAFKQQKDMMVNLATSILLGSVVADTGVDRSTGQMKFVSKNPLRTQNTVSKTVIYAALINGFSDNVWSTAWGRTQEDQADLLGTDLMIRAGYASRGANYSLERLNDYQGKQAPLLSSFLDERKSAMKESLEQLNVNRFNQELNLLINGGLSNGLKTATNYFQRAHMSPLDRDEELRKYLQREYPQQRRAHVDKRSWPKVRDAAPVAVALQAYRDANSVIFALAKNDMHTAEAANAKALASPVRNQPGIRKASFTLHLTQGRKQEAMKDLASIKDWSLASPELYDFMIAYQLGQRDPAGALVTIDKGERTLGSQELFIAQKVQANLLLQNTGQVESLLKQCEQYPARRQSCKKMASVKA